MLLRAVPKTHPFLKAASIFVRITLAQSSTEPPDSFHSSTILPSGSFLLPSSVPIHLTPRPTNPWPSHAMSNGSASRFSLLLTTCGRSRTTTIHSTLRLINPCRYNTLCAVTTCTTRQHVLRKNERGAGVGSTFPS